LNLPLLLLGFERHRVCLFCRFKDGHAC
jgi:hypothetical protein